MELDLPSGPVKQVYSPALRRVVDTFLMNTSQVQTEFRSVVQGRGGGFEEQCDAILLGYFKHDTCSAAMAILPNRKWLLHATDQADLRSMIRSVPEDIAPMRIGGEADIVRHAIEIRGSGRPTEIELREYAHLELSPQRVPHGSGGQHRLARSMDMRRLEEYVSEYESEVGDILDCDWDALVSDSRVLMAVVEGTIASFAVRAASTLDRILIKGVYTFKPFRRRGLAGSLVASLAHQAAGRGQATAAIVGVNNEPMLALLDSLRFRKTADYITAVYHDESV